MDIQSEIEKQKKAECLTEKQRLFCEYYTLDWNATQAAIKAGYSKDTAGSIGHENLTKPEIQAYIKVLQDDIEKQVGISKFMVLSEAKKIAFSSIASLHNTWITLNEFEALTEEQKACISQIETQKRVETKYVGDQEVPWEVEYVKIRLHDKIRGLELINKMLGYNSEERINVTTPVKKFLIVPASSGKRTDNE